MADLYLLDTNILVHFVRSDAVWRRVRANYSLMVVQPTPHYSVVTGGELRSLAHQFGWAAAKVSQMHFAFNYFRRVSLDDNAVLEAFAAIDSYAKRIGRPMGENDVWIAATAHVMGAKLLTTDRDFDIISPTFIDRIWIDPTTP